MSGPKVLFIDIETAPILGYVWGLWDNNVALNQIHSDWHILSWSAKWADSKEVIQLDQRNAKSIENDKSILLPLHALLDKADIVVTQNGKAFDTKKINARFVLNDIKPPSSYRQIDTYLLAKKHFGFTSNKLEYMTGKLCTKYKKMTKRKFDGFELWKECLAGNKKAWIEMAKYNKLDVLALEELYYKLIPWDNSVNFNVYSDTSSPVCTCGSMFFVKNGYAYTSTGKYQRYQCSSCGSELKAKNNELPKDKKKSIKIGTVR